MYTENKKEAITIYTQKLAGYLMLRGFVLIRSEPGNDKSGRNVFFLRMPYLIVIGNTYVKKWIWIQTKQIILT